MHIWTQGTGDSPWNRRHAFRPLDIRRNPDSLKSIRFIFLLAVKLSAISTHNQARPAKQGE
jgi:hypothetical protein